jgi:hypothetical protein
VIVGHGGQTGCPTTTVMVLLQSLDCTNIQAMAKNTNRIRPLATTLPKHSAQRMKEETMDMTTIHTTALGTILPQHSVSCMEAEAMATSTVHTTLWDPHPSFGMAHEGRSHGYDYGPHNTTSNIPPSTFDFALE